MITICSVSTVVTCVKRRQIWSNDYCLCNMFHVFLFVLFFLFVSSFQFLQLPALTPDTALYVHGACSCNVVYLGGSYASGALSAFVRVSRHKTLCMYHLSHCFLLVFVFCLINIFSSSSFKFKFWYSECGTTSVVPATHNCWVQMCLSMSHVFILQRYLRLLAPCCNPTSKCHTGMSTTSKYSNPPGCQLHL